MTKQFSLTWDYRCPFARNAHEHVLDALEAGADWDVTFVPFSLDQAHVQDGDPSVWDQPEKVPNLLAGEVGIVVRDRYPDQFLAAHRGLFSARHDLAGDLREREVVAAALDSAGLDATTVLKEVDEGWARETYRKEHLAAVSEYAVFGVPTFVIADQAAFVLLMNRPNGDAQASIDTVEGILDLLEGRPEINELKHTRIPK
ncbi:MAG: DsbA family protein [Acidimicrobiales bacterium]